jgi:hypothetical protein
MLKLPNAYFARPFLSHNNNGPETLVECVEYMQVEHVWMEYHAAEPREWLHEVLKQTSA